MDEQIFKADIHSHLADFVEHLETIKLASIYQNATETFKPPNLLLYYPQSSNEIEIQRFNMVGEISSRLLSADMIASWILDTESLIREKVGIYLTSSTLSRSDTISPSLVLEALAKKICSLEVSEGFVEGLRVFLPICGGIYVDYDNTTVTSNTNANVYTTSATSTYKYIFNEKSMSILLRSYVKAHLLYSKSPIIAWKELHLDIDENLMDILITIAKYVLETYKSLSGQEKTLTNSSNDFLVLVKESLKKSSLHIPMESKTINDMFAAISNGGDLVPLYIPEGTPSYLFASIIKSGWVRLGFNTDVDVMLRSFVRLCEDALYLFVDSEAPSAQGCIPLEYLRPQLSDNIETYSTIILLPVLDKVMPYVAMSPTMYQRGSYKWSAPEEVTYHAKFVLEILDEEISLEPNLSKIISSPLIQSLPSQDASSDQKAKFRKHVEVIAQWLDVLEATSWSCRNEEDLQ